MFRTFEAFIVFIHCDLLQVTVLNLNYNGVKQLQWLITCQPLKHSSFYVALMLLGLLMQDLNFIKSSAKTSFSGD